MIRYFKQCPAVAWFLLCSFASATEHEILATPVSVLTSSDSSIFPESWREAPISATGAALDTSKFERVSSILQRALSKYPEPFLLKHLEKVYVLADLRYSGVGAAGTNSRTAVYVRVGDEESGYTDQYIESTFHAELSSILLRNHEPQLDTEAWKSLNPRSFRYSIGDGVGAIKAGRASLRGDREYHEQGFLSQYAQSSLENDFNGYAAALFTGDRQLWQLAEQHTAIKAKLELVIAFYQSLDPIWAKERFLNSDFLKATSP